MAALAGDRRICCSLAAAPIKVGEAMPAAPWCWSSPAISCSTLRDRALAHLFDLTLLATALAALFAFSVATFISVRIGRLRAAADAAVGNDGRIRLRNAGVRQRR